MKLSSAAAPVHPKVIWAGAVTLSFGVVVYEIEKYTHYHFDGTETAFLTALLGIGVGYFKSAPAPAQKVRVVSVPTPVSHTLDPRIETWPEHAVEEEEEVTPVPAPSEPERQEHGFMSAPRAPEWGKTA
jgi:hypothetical protein